MRQKNMRSATMDDYVKRMVEEEIELDVRVNKLEVFNVSHLFGILAVEEQERLIKQENAMISYRDTLRCRIKYAKRKWAISNVFIG